MNRQLRQSMSDAPNITAYQEALCPESLEPGDRLQRCELLRQAEDSPRIAMQNQIHQFERVGERQPAFVHQLAQGERDPPPHKDGVT
jgi:hypothetical protein